MLIRLIFVLVIVAVQLASLVELRSSRLLDG